MEELHGVPAQLQEVRQSLMRLQNQQTESAADCAHKSAIFEEPSFNQRNLDQMLAQEPHLQLVGTQHIADCQIVRAIVTE